ncbi:MAG: Gfo/Idh/MocA family oxidoreductase [Clostridia bacterium]|nr:Gfo/Idh/MocA family oxidoreductase [Clostridia bacterium]
MKKLRVAIIGYGRSGQQIHGAFFASDKNEKYEVAIVVDELEVRRAQAKAKHNCEVFADYHEILDRKDIDLVVNATYSYLHAPVAIDFLQHGFHVVSEKPFAVHAADCQAMIDAAKENNVMLCVFQQSHFAPYYRRIHEILDSGILGRIAEIKIQFSGFARRWDWQCLQSWGGGCLRNTGPHPFEQALDLLDSAEMPQVVSRLDIVNSYGDAEDFCKVLLLQKDKPVIDLEISSCNAYADFTYLIEGSTGSLKATTTAIDYKYYDPNEVEARTVVKASLQTQDGSPRYCGETLPWKTAHEDMSGTAFDAAVLSYYNNIYDHLTEGAELIIKPAKIKQMIALMEEIHRQNPLPVKY